MVTSSPLRELQAMEDRMRRALEGLGRFPTVAGPAADVFEREGQLVVELEVPGFEQQELTVEVTDHALIVRGEHEATREDDQDRAFHLRERVERRFERRFGLPDEVDVAAAAADYRNGVLTVRMPKREGSKPRVVDIAGS